MDSDTTRERPLQFVPPDSDHLRRVDAVVAAALDLPHDARQAFLRDSCRDDAKLREDAERLLAACDSANEMPNFLQGTAAELVAPVVEELLSQSAPSGATTMAPAMAAALGDRYAVVRGIGRGGAANVYLADDRTHGRQVAIKVLRPELAETTAATRFVREIRLMSRLEHPRIVPVLDAGEVAGVSYYVLPYMDGRSLRDRLTGEKQMPIGEAVAIAVTLADALQYAHERGMVHRDVKPENILFSGGEAHLADFGIARALEQSHGESSTTTGLVRGTVPYMSPEQASGNRDIDGRSDVYALGCVLYEMLAGMPAFVGPSPEAILAQKLLHPARDLRIYRPNVSPRLSAVVLRALQIAPADRFRSAGEFAEALRALTSEDWVIGEVSPGPKEHPWRRRGLIAGRMIALVIVGALVLSPDARSRLLPTLTRQSPDTTIIAILPLERGDAARARPLDDDQLLHDALSWWRGVVPIDRFLVSDALRRRGPIVSSRDASSLTSSLGAGRYVRGSIGSQGDTWRVYAGLFDVGRPGSLRQASVTIPSDLTGARSAYARLTRTLLVRDAEPDSSSVDAGATSSLPAAQALSRAQVALDAWDLGAADSAFQGAIGFDPDYARASLFLAQVRAWRGLPARTWMSLAARASADPSSLSEREHDLASGLVLLGSARYEQACGVYDRLRQKNSRDFAAWFGLGMCRELDHAVIRDPSAPSGRRFRSSYHSAIVAYSTAFDILPSVHRGYERGAFDEVLRLLLPVGTEIVFGYGIDGDSARYAGRPVWNDDGDSLVLVPYSPQSVTVGASSTTPSGFTRALEHLHRQFRTIASGWSAAYPRSAGAKQAVAISLELDGDARAIDTMHLARKFASSRQRKIEIGAAEVLLRVKFGIPSDVRQLTAARNLADSLLEVAAPTSAEAEALAPLAALTGRCTSAEQLVRASSMPTYRLQVPEQVVADAQVLAVRLALGCSEGRSSPRLKDLAGAIARDPSAARPQDRQYLDARLLFRPALYGMPLDSALLERVAQSSAHPLVRAALALARHQPAQARATLSEFHAQMRVNRSPWTPDMELPGVALLVLAGDTLTAVDWLDRRLEEIRALNPKALRDPVRSAAFIRATVLRADLAMAKRDSSSAKRWARVGATLWHDGDAELSGEANRMARYARMP